jgi:type IX secretion system PorP/SprF family membrane protein
MKIKPNIPSKIKAFVFCLVLFLSSSIFSQDVHFSQSVASLQQNNASFSPFFDGDIQVASVYREQWGAIGVPFVSSYLIVNSKIHRLNDQFGVFGGFQYLNDRSGDAKLNVNNLNLNLGISYFLDENTFCIAIMNGLVVKQFNANNLTFPQQYDRNIGGFNESLDHGESFNSDQLNYYNLGVGLSWQRIISNNWTILTGFSIDNLTKGKESFFEESNTKKIGWGLQGEANYRWKKTISLVPYLSYYKSYSASELVFGSGLKFKTRTESNVSFIQPFAYLRSGVNRNSDAIILGSYLGIKQLSIGASYDFNISNLEIASNYQGGFELSLAYIFKGKSINKRTIPCERY